MDKSLVFGGAGVIALLTVFIGLSMWPPERGGPGPFPAPIACTLEAKLCPDGSSVGRQGPNCEFAACPGAQTVGGWETFRDPARAFSFQYPKVFPATYISAVDWPPEVSFQSGSYSCVEAEGETERRFVNGREYCVTRVSEGAAGSIYTQYEYLFSQGGQAAVLTFGLRYVQCGNYPEPRKSACEEERSTLDIDGIVDRIATSIRLE